MTASPKSSFSLGKDAVILGVVGFVLLLFGLRFAGQTHLVPLGTSVDLGSVSVGQTTEKQFLVVNSSSRTIEILRWSVSCHCMQADFIPSTVPAYTQASAFIRTTGESPLGPRAVVGTVQWRYQGEQFFRTDHFDARARYVSAIALSKERLDFGKISFNGGSVQALSVKNGNTDIRWDGLEVVTDSVNLTSTVAKDPAGFTIDFRLNPRSIPTGVWKNGIRIYPLLNGIRTGIEVKLPVVAQVEGPFEVTPRVIQFPANSDRPLHFSLKIHSVAKPITKLAFAGSLVQCTKTSIAPGGRDAMMNGVLLVPQGSGVYVGKIPILINDDPAQMLGVHFLGFASDGPAVSDSITSSSLGRRNIASNGTMPQK